MPQTLRHMQDFMLFHSKVGLDMTNQVLKVPEIGFIRPYILRGIYCIEERIKGIRTWTQWASKSLAKGAVVNVRYGHEFEPQSLEFAHCLNCVWKGRPDGDTIRESYAFGL